MLHAVAHYIHYIPTYGHRGIYKKKKKMVIDVNSKALTAARWHDATIYYNIIYMTSVMPRRNDLLGRHVSFSFVLRIYRYLQHYTL